MPIYEYLCQKCGEEIEVIQKVSEPPLKEHEGCGGRLEKALSLSAFHLKGGGWYADGYSQKSKETNPAKEDKPAKSEGGEKPQKTTDKKTTDKKTEKKKEK